MTELRPTYYPHRFNGDGSYDSICPKCFAMVAKVTVIADLAEYERNHICEESISDESSRSNRRRTFARSKRWVV
jgi:hypothetical protein